MEYLLGWTPTGQRRMVTDAAQDSRHVRRRLAVADVQHSARHEDRIEQHRTGQDKTEQDREQDRGQDSGQRTGQGT